MRLLDVRGTAPREPQTLDICYWGQRFVIWPHVLSCGYDGSSVGVGACVRACVRAIRMSPCTSTDSVHGTKTVGSLISPRMRLYQFRSFNQPSRGSRCLSVPNSNTAINKSDSAGRIRQYYTRIHHSLIHFCVSTLKGHGLSFQTLCVHLASIPAL